MEEYQLQILKGIGGLLFIQPVVAVFQQYLDVIKDEDQLRESFEYHFPIVLQIIDKFKNEK